MMHEGARIMWSVLDSGDEFGALTVREFCERYPLGHTKAYEEINAGRLRAVKCGSRTLILARDARAWERSLPPLGTA
jgi:hypothetical protein